MRIKTKAKRDGLAGKGKDGDSKGKVGILIFFEYLVFVWQHPFCGFLPTSQSVSQILILLYWVFTTKSISKVLYLSICHIMYNYVGFSPLIQPVRKSVKWYSRTWYEHICVWEKGKWSVTYFHWLLAVMSNHVPKLTFHSLYTNIVCGGFNLVNYLAEVESARFSV